MEPPALRAADCACSGALVVQYVERNDRTFGDRRDERRMSGGAEVLTEPPDGGRHGGVYLFGGIWCGRARRSASGSLRPSQQKTFREVEALQSRSSGRGL